MIPGDKKGDWTVLAVADPHPKSGLRRLLVQCSCGSKFVRNEGDIAHGRSKRCIKCSKRIKSKAWHAKSRRS